MSKVGEELQGVVVSKSTSTRIKYWMRAARDRARLLKANTLPNNRFVIVTQSRSGSGLLKTLLSNHPSIFLDQEIFNKAVSHVMRNPALFLRDRMTRASASKKSVYGFKFKYHHLSDHQNLGNAATERFIKELSVDGWSFIYLRRNNILRRALSDQVARNRGGKLHAREGEALAKARIDVDELIRSLKISSKLNSVDQKLMDTVPHLLVEYETELLPASAHSVTAARVFEHLRLPPAEVHTKLKRTSTDDLSQTIENYGELLEKLTSTEYGSMLQT